ncbi:MAG: dockerin type I domain-containing protein, partial [Candidatus Poribacteria bacterium]|nr:dockerin type I domain-containing protein [Candidatus Poribacteria bacterium]
SNLREPSFTLLWGSVDHKPPTSQQTVRQFTTLSLTHSDGYVNVSSGHPDIRTLWYDFWDAPLGRPVGGDETKAQLYENREGLFIREFTNGWAVYNRSGAAQEIELPQEVSGWSSGVENQRQHTLADLDGEIYLKSGLETSPTADVNGDGVVNIQDLVIVANALGEAAPDLNGDGVVNIQDLVIVANAF